MTISNLPFPKQIGKSNDYKLATSRNFGIVVLPINCQDKRGFNIPKRVFSY